MPVELPLAWTIVADIAGWPIIHLGVAWGFTRLPSKMFASPPLWFVPTGSEASIYAWIGVRRWKKLLPDAAPWFKGFAKERLQSLDADYVRQFIAETWRGECAHWVMMLMGAIFFLWNPPWADGVMILYALAANLPCIITQRYNRYRLSRLRRTKYDRSLGNLKA